MEVYHKSQGIFGVPAAGECDYSQELHLDLSTVEPSVAGPKRPQDRISLNRLKSAFSDLSIRPVAQGGYGKANDDLIRRHPSGKDNIDIGDGDVLIAAITSCTNTSNPSVILAAGLLAKKAVERGFIRVGAGKNIISPRLQSGQRLSATIRPPALSGKTRLSSSRIRLHHMHRQFRPLGCRL